MKITPVNHANLINAYNKVSKPPQVEKPAVETGDQVSFSTEALTFSSVFTEIKQKLTERTPEEQAHFEEIKAKVQAGEYKVDSEAVAERIINNYIFQK